jgi:hypothetical protein
MSPREDAAITPLCLPQRPASIHQVTERNGPKRCWSEVSTANSVGLNGKNEARLAGFASGQSLALLPIEAFWTISEDEFSEVPC